MSDNDLLELTKLMRQEEGIKMPPNIMQHVYDAKHTLDDFFDVIEMVKKPMVYSSEHHNIGFF